MKKVELKLEIEVINYLLKTNEHVLLCVKKDKVNFDILFHDTEGHWFAISFDKELKEKGLLYNAFWLVEFHCTKSSFYPVCIGALGSFGTAERHIQMFIADALAVIKHNKAIFKTCKRKNEYAHFYEITEPMDEKTLYSFLLNNNISYC